MSEQEKTSTWAQRREAQRDAAKKKKATHKRLNELIAHVTEGVEHAEELATNAVDLVGGSSQNGAEKLRVADMVQRALRGEPIEGRADDAQLEADSGELSSDEEAEDSYADETSASDDNDTPARAGLFCPVAGGSQRHRRKKKQ